MTPTLTLLSAASSEGPRGQPPPTLRQALSSLQRVRSGLRVSEAVELGGLDRVEHLVDPNMGPGLFASSAHGDGLPLRHRKQKRASLPTIHLWKGRSAAPMLEGNGKIETGADRL